MKIKDILKLLNLLTNKVLTKLDEIFYYFLMLIKYFPIESNKEK